MGESAGIDLPQIGAVDFARFKKKARHFLLDHQDNLTLQKIRRGKPLTRTDIQQLGDMLIQAGVGDQQQVELAAETSKGLGRFIRSLVGLERAAVAEAFSEFLTAGTASADQIEFVEMIIEHLTEKGVMDPKMLYESPFIDIAAEGPEQVFSMERADRLFEVIEGINTSAGEEVA